ncbi:MAG: aspartate carbamoyltransferase catalytic subunit [Actinobacteria bacterium]|uniref:aspartate carbamoyltransferase n=1 Tax=freshwater metagenome TaxID=449393 RepID=A0A6J6KDD7_9ZZZZ|nr:aspartate carbamoyltransferase catalytic subunit [Actinomycetota bacterium]
MKHLLSTQELDVDQALTLLDTAEEFQAVANRQVPKLPTLRGVTMVNLFFEDSTRTRLSFEAAAQRLSADIMTFQVHGSSVSKGESLKDTAQTLAAMGADVIVIRHPSSGAPTTLARSGWVNSSIINAGDGAHEHPTQALLDAMTLRQRFHSEPRGALLTGLSVAIVGDIVHSRVARSNVFLLTTLGAKVTLVGPPALLPQGVDDWPVHSTHDLDDAIDSAPDAVMMLRVQRERMGDGSLISHKDYVRNYSLTRARADRLPQDSIVMHPGPMNRGVEIASQVADSSRSVILDQVRNGVSVRMAALYELRRGQA